MEDGPPIFSQDFSCPDLLIANLVLSKNFWVQGYHLLRQTFPGHSPNLYDKDCWLIRFRSPLLSESQLISIPEVTKMFQFSSFASISYVFRYRYLGYPRWVFPFGNLRIKVCYRLPEAYRKLLRPSSPLAAKASTVCTSLLDHITSINSMNISNISIYYMCF